MKSFYNRILEFYVSYPNASLDDVLIYFKKKPTKCVMQTIVLAQTRIRGAYPGKRRNTHSHAL